MKEKPYGGRGSVGVCVFCFRFLCTGGRCGGDSPARVEKNSSIDWCVLKNGCIGDQITNVKEIEL